MCGQGKKREGGRWERLGPHRAHRASPSVQALSPGLGGCAGVRASMPSLVEQHSGPSCREQDLSGDEAGGRACPCALVAPGAAAAIRRCAEAWLSRKEQLGGEKAQSSETSRNGG